MARSPRLVAHAAMETYSVLTRLPPPHRAPPDLVHQFLAEEFPAQWLALRPQGYRALVRDLASAPVVGGAVYDALIAAVAASHKATLATCDRRAKATYDAVGAQVELIS
jgi:predicted nucleic acid-binding protein